METGLWLWAFEYGKGLLDWKMERCDTMILETMWTRSNPVVYASSICVWGNGGIARAIMKIDSRRKSSNMIDWRAFPYSVQSTAQSQKLYPVENLRKISDFVAFCPNCRWDYPDGIFWCNGPFSLHYSFIIHTIYLDFRQHFHCSPAPLACSCFCIGAMKWNWISTKQSYSAYTRHTKPLYYNTSLRLSWWHMKALNSHTSTLEPHVCSYYWPVLLYRWHRWQGWCRDA